MGLKEYLDSDHDFTQPGMLEELLSHLEDPENLPELYTYWNTMHHVEEAPDRKLQSRQLYRQIVKSIDKLRKHIGLVKNQSKFSYT